ncbi:DUF397 domain-containing protein [Streptomyces sp. XM4193]|uniref:DUF397 domain-containing protein n=1 Tax=Streptomyces sp. XM4193 TaxID=2929782 RepID=UPI001FF8904A|nr:DUF397 domain-containing protein [Streptomyces sp. XM4193]MCK1795940.1 DUF397 domain-containing protein [Streptomyces sp. XM4193]
MSTRPDMSRLTWVKSSYSGGGGGQCVEYSRGLLPYGSVPVRDSKCPSGPAVVFSAGAFAAFVAAVRSESLGR